MQDRARYVGRGRIRVVTRLKREDSAVVDRVAELSGRSRAFVVADLIDTMMPFVRQQLEVMEKIRATPELSETFLADMAARARAEIDQAELQFREGRRGRQRG